MISFRFRKGYNFFFFTEGIDSLHRYMVKIKQFCVGKKKFQRSLDEKDKSLRTTDLKREVRDYIKLGGKLRKDLQYQGDL